MKLTDRFEQDTIELDGYKYNLDFTFDNILRIYELKDDSEIPIHLKIHYMFEMLVINCDLEITILQKRYIVDQILNTMLAKEDVKEKFRTELESSEQPNQKIYDFTKDAEFIYASFLMDYGMDLIEQQGVLHWNRFIALLNGLSKNTPFMQVVNIRTMEVPKLTKHNAKERQKIINLKHHYSLMSDKEKVEAMDRQFDAVANAIIKAGGK